MDRSRPKGQKGRFVHGKGTNKMQEKKKKSSIGNSKRISYRDKKKPKIEQENKGKMLDTFRESQDKYGSHLEEPLG